MANIPRGILGVIAGTGGAWAGAMLGAGSYGLLDDLIAIPLSSPRGELAGLEVIAVGFLVALFPAPAIFGWLIAVRPNYRRWVLLAGGTGLLAGGMLWLVFPYREGLMNALMVEGGWIGAAVSGVMFGRCHHWFMLRRRARQEAGNAEAQS